MRYTVLILALLMVCGCGRHKTTDYGADRVVSIETTAISFINTPPDGRYGDKIFRGTGQQTARALASALAPYTQKIIFGEQTSKQEAIFAAAKNAGARYVYIPSIVAWEYRRPMSWRRSKLTLDIKVFDLSQPEGGQLILHKELYEEGSNNVTPDSKPAALVQDMFERFAKAAFMPEK